MSAIPQAGAGSPRSTASPISSITTIPQVIARMEAIDASLGRKDGVAIFDRLYLQVTRAVDAASAGTDFEDPVFVKRLDVIFAGLYFEAEATIDSGGQCPVAWRPLVAVRSERREPIQFALAGMAAHINHDLPIAVVKTCEEQGLVPQDGSIIHRDYQRVDALLQTVETQVAGWFDSGLIADIEDVTPERTDAAVAMWSIAGARDLAWEHAKLIWRLRSHAELLDRYLDVLARTTELAAKAMLV